MCIICNCDIFSKNPTAFLNAFDRASGAIKAASDLMKKCSQEAIDKDVKRQYDKTHKRMVRILREFNSLEHFRELETKIPTKDENTQAP